MAIPVVEFSREGYKIKKVFWLKIKCSQMNLPNLENGVVASCFFFSLKNMKLGAQLSLMTLSVKCHF